MIQLPIALLATASNFYNGSLNVALGGLLAIGVSLGAWSGAKIAHAVPTGALRNMVAVVLIAVGALIFFKVATRHFG